MVTYAKNTETKRDLCFHEENTKTAQFFKNEVELLDSASHTFLLKVRFQYAVSYYIRN